MKERLQRVGVRTADQLLSVLHSLDRMPFGIDATLELSEDDSLWELFQNELPSLTEFNLNRVWSFDGRRVVADIGYSNTPRGVSSYADFHVNDEDRVRVYLHEMVDLLDEFFKWTNKKRRWKIGYTTRVVAKTETSIINRSIANWWPREWLAFIDAIVTSQSKKVSKLGTYNLFVTEDLVADDLDKTWFISLIRDRQNRCYTRSITIREIESYLNRFDIESLEPFAPYNARIDYLLEQLEQVC